MCLRCARDKFDRPGPHRCNGQYRKRGLRWAMVVTVDLEVIDG